MKILREELGDEYDDYNLTPERHFTLSEIDKIIRLRKNYMGIQKISKNCNIPTHFIARILRKELEDEYHQYVRPNSYENIKKRFQEEVQEIINLRRSGKSIKEIQDETGFSAHFIVRFIAEETGEDLKYGWQDYRKGIQSEKNVLRYLSDAYDNFAEDILALRYESLINDHTYTNSLRKFQLLKPRCISQFFTMWKKMPITRYRSPDIICTPFIFTFFKVNNIHVASSLFLQDYDFNRHKWHESLKRIYTYFPGFMYRDRKQLIMGRINEVKNSFTLSSRFHKNAKVLLEKLWSYLNSTTDDVIAGTISALSLLSIKSDTIRINDLCKKIGISHSTIIYQIKYKLFKTLKISGFKTLTTSKELIHKEIFEKIIGLENLGYM